MYETIREREELAKELADELPGALSKDGLNISDVTRLYHALEGHVQASERIVHDICNAEPRDDALLHAAEQLNEMFGTLAAAVAGKMVELRRLSS